MNVSIIVQARMSSSRLPGKVLKKAMGFPMLAYLLEQIAPCQLPIILALPKEDKRSFEYFLNYSLPSFAMIRSPIKKISSSLNNDTPSNSTPLNQADTPSTQGNPILGYPKITPFFFDGDTRDVLARFLEVRKVYPFDFCVRVTADNPFTSGECLLKIVERHIEKHRLYTTKDGHLHGLPEQNDKKTIAENAPDISFFEGLPYGTGVEVISDGCLVKLALLKSKGKLTKDDCEHVTAFAHSNPNIFSIYKPRIGREYYFPKYRLTVDTQEDWDQFVNRLEKLEENNKMIQLKEIIELETKRLRNRS